MEIIKTLAPLVLKGATAYLTAKTSSPSTSLARAAAEGDTRAVETLLSQDHPLDLAPALVAAASAGKMDVLEILIDAPVREHALHRGKNKDKSKGHEKPKPKPTNVNIWAENITPLIAAVQTHHVKTARLLLEAGANASLAPPGGETALHIASRMGDVAMVRVLVENGARLEAEDGWGNTGLLSAARWGHPETIKYLLGQGADIYARDAKGSTALLLACRHDCVAAVRVLLASGADVHARDYKGRGALHRAMAGVNVIEGVDAKVKEEIVRMLINAGAEPRTRDRDGKRAGDMVGFWRGGENVRRLLSAGCTPAHSRRGSRTGSPHLDGVRNSHDFAHSPSRHESSHNPKSHSRPHTPKLHQPTHKATPKPTHNSSHHQLAHEPALPGDMVDGYDRD
ncbi:hypothetical protein NHQ30_001460 [Ciborinia camelliae]|nr:hypothetical protein NHQ30_001460 [Ciborinia camelliae]